LLEKFIKVKILILTPKFITALWENMENMKNEG